MTINSMDEFKKRINSIGTFDELKKSIDIRGKHLFFEPNNHFAFRCEQIQSEQCAGAGTSCGFDDQGDQIRQGHSDDFAETLPGEICLPIWIL